MFINYLINSVVAVYAEKPSSLRLNGIQDASAYFNARYFDNSWANYSGGYTETSRRIAGDHLIIEFKLRDQGKDYVARQVSRLDKGWLLTLRMTVQDNDSELLNRLDQKLTPGFTFYPEVAAAPIFWATLRDPAATTAPPYFVKYPAQWIFVSALNGANSVVSGANVLMNVTTEPNKVIGSAQSARVWVTATQADAKIVTVKPETRGTVRGFSVSYQYTNSDGKPQSSVATLLNGPNKTLYALLIRTSLANVDLLSSAADSLMPDLPRVRATFTLLPPGSYLSLPRLKVQPTDIPTATPAPNPLAFDMKTAQIYRSPDGFLQIKLPIGWTPNVDDDFKGYTFAVEPGFNAFIIVRIDTLIGLYQFMLDNEMISTRLDLSTLSAETLLKALRDTRLGQTGAGYTEIHPIQMGTLHGLAFTYNKPNTSSIHSEGFPLPYETRLIMLPDGQVAYLQASAYSMYLEKAAPVMSTMLDSLVINDFIIPTPTITPTPYPLLLTGTALQQQFDALTATSDGLTATSDAQSSTLDAPTETALPSVTATPNSPTDIPTLTPTTAVGTLL